MSGAGHSLSPECRSVELKVLDSRLVAYSDERKFLTSEPEFSWEIPASRVKYRIVGRPSPEKAASRHVGFASFPVNDNAVSQDLSRARVSGSSPIGN